MAAPVWACRSPRALSSCMVATSSISPIPNAARPLASSCPAHRTMEAQILIVEDDSSLAASLQKIVCAEDYTVEVASRGDEGLKRALAGSFDVVISDLKLPGLDGLELVARLHTAKPKLP